MRLILIAILAIQAAPAQSEADRVEAAIKKWTDREYRCLAEGKELGVLAFKDRVEVENNRKVAVFETVLKLERDGKSETMSKIEKSEMQGLRFLSLQAVGPDGKVERVLEAKDGKVELKSFDGKSKTVEVTKATVGEMSLFRLPCVLDQKVGTQRKVDVLDFSSLQKDFDLRCEEKTTIEIAGTKHEAFRWRMSGNRKMELPSGTDSLKFEFGFWVSPEGVLLRYTMDVADKKDVNVLELKK